MGDHVTAALPPDTIDLRRAFVDLLLEDEELVRSEFEAIVAEEQWWEPTPPEVPQVDPGQPPERRIPPSGAPCSPAVTGGPPRQRWVRERSPPQEMSS